MRRAMGSLVAAALLAGLAVAEIPEPFPKWELKPVEEAYPAFARRDPPVFTVEFEMEATPKGAWEAMKDQLVLVKHMLHCKQVFNFTGSPGDWLMVVQWHTPNRWHRWTRTDVRKYTTLDNKAKSLSYFLVGGFGLWMPRLAFRETVLDHPDPTLSKLFVEVWYEFDETKIGWPVDNLINLTKERWTLFYSHKEYGYGSAIESLLVSPHEKKPTPTIGFGRVTDPQKLKRYEL